METDVDGGYPALCNAGDARPVHHTAAHLLGQAVLAPWLDARARVNESIADAGAEVNMLMLEVDEA